MLISKCEQNIGYVGIKMWTKYRVCWYQNVNKI